MSYDGPGPKASELAKASAEIKMKKQHLDPRDILDEFMGYNGEEKHRLAFKLQAAQTAMPYEYSKKPTEQIIRNTELMDLVEVVKALTNLNDK